MLGELRAQADSAPFAAREHALQLIVDYDRASATHWHIRYLAALALKRMGQILEALQEMEQIARQCQRRRHLALAAEVLDELAGDYMELGLLNQTMKAWVRCTNLSIEAGLPDMQIKGEMGIGKAYWVLADYATADRFHQQAAQHAETLQQIDGRAAALLCRTYNLIHLGRYTEADEVLARAKQPVFQHHNPHWHAEFHHYTAIVAHALGHGTRAEEAGKEGWGLAFQLNFMWQLAQIALTRHHIALASGDDTPCMVWLDLALFYASRINNDQWLAATYRARADYFRSCNRHDDALQALKMWLKLETQVRRTRTEIRLSSATRRQVAQIETLLQLASSTRENHLLQESLKAKSVALHELNQAAMTDALTGVYNRRALEAAFEQIDQGDGAVNTVVMVDIDHFKQINDLFGHAIGDRVLAQLGALLRENCRQNEVIARYGGEEFCLLLAVPNAALAQSIVERLRKRVSESDWSGILGSTSCTLSAGLALRHPNEPVRQTLQRADRALYEAKRAGRNQLVCAR
ncbi:diguanylate cyclase [Chitinibacteraceae bacterium HSL-7]